MSVSEITTLVQFFLGMALVISGYNIFRSTPAVGGFIIGGLLAVNLAIFFIQSPPQWAEWMPALSFVAGGIIGAVIAIPLQIVIAIVSSSALGLLIGALAGFIIAWEGMTSLLVTGLFEMGSVSPLQGLLMIVFGVFFGFLALRFDDFMIMASTAFLGAFLAVLSLSALGGATYPILTDEILLFFLWAAMGLFGLIWQNYHVD